ncbi:MAG: oligosaccharide flippase family protein, partial [Gemmatimonadota bacterium]
DGTSRGVLLIVGVMRFIDAISDIFYGLFQRHERLDMAGVSLTLRALSSLALFTAALAATGELVPALAASSCAWLAVLLGHDAPRARRLLARDVDSAAASGRARWAALRPTWDLSRHARLALFALPLGINVLLDTLWTNFPRYVLERTDGTIALGIFAALGAIMASSSLVITALGQSISPRLARYRAAGQRGAFVRLLLVAIALGGSLGVIGFIVAASLGSEILSALYGAEYARYSPALTWMMAAIAMQNAYMFCGTATTVLRRFWVQFAIQVASFALMVPLSLHLIQREGVTGASKSLFYTNLLEAVVYTIVVVTLLRDFSRRSPSAYGYITMASAGKTRALNNE